MSETQGLIGFPAYGARIGLGMGMQYASLEMTMAQNEQRYSGPEWDEYWQYAKEAVGFVQQQLADRQFVQVERLREQRNEQLTELPAGGYLQICHGRSGQLQPVWR